MWRRLAITMTVLGQLIAPAYAQQNTNVICSSFVKNDDGSWSALRNVSVPGAGGSFNVREGAQFRPGASFAGLDLAAQLEKDCPAAVQQQIEVAKQVDVQTYEDKSGNIDMQTLTCGQLALTRPADSEFLALWLSGWSNGVAKRQTVNVVKIKNGMRNLLAYCKANPDKKVVQANDELIRAEKR